MNTQDYENEVIIPYNGEISDLLRHEQKFSFLVGAGISMEEPTCIPSAPQFVRELLDLYAPKEDIDSILAIKSLRYEIIVEKIQEICDPNLKFLDYLGTINTPNIIHYFLANSIQMGFPVITTNFDYMIEKAIEKSSKNSNNIEKSSQCELVITKSDFNNLNNNMISNSENNTLNPQNQVLIKLHGSKKNYFTNDNTESSLVTTISALSKGKSETFGLESYKEESFKNLTENSTLIVMGYSGSDDFDISPTLKIAKSINRLIWIEHDTSDSPNLLKIRSQNENLDISKAEGIDKFLADITLNSGIEVYRLNGNTLKIINKILWNNILKDKIEDNSLIKQIYKNESPRIDFKSWASTYLQETSLYQKYRFACDILLNSSSHENLYKTIERGLNINDLPVKEYCLMNLGFIKSFEIKYEECVDYLKQSIEISEKIGYYEDLAWASINLGDVYNQLVIDLDKSLFYYNKALTILDKQDNKIQRTTAYLGIGFNYFRRKEIEQTKKYFQLSEEIIEKEGLLALKISLLRGKSSLVIIDDYDFDKVFEYTTEGIRIAEETGNINKLVFLRQDLGNLYYNKQLYDKAIETYKMAVQDAKKANDIASEQSSYTLLAMYYSRNNLFTDAKYYLELALKLVNEAKKKQEDALLFECYGDYFFNQDDLPNAMIYYNKALQYGNEMLLDHVIADCKNQLGRIYYKNKDYLKAAEYFSESNELYSCIHNEYMVDRTEDNLMSTYNRISETMEPRDIENFLNKSELALIPHIKSQKYKFQPNEKVKISVYSKFGIDPSAWVGIVPSHIPHNDEIIADENQMGYFTMGKSVYIRLTITVPEEEGSYDFRLYDNDDDGEELCSTSFEVVKQEASIRTQKNEFRSGEPIKLEYILTDEYSDSAWIGIFKSSMKSNSKTDLDRENLFYCKCEVTQLGIINLNAPKYAGEYKIKLFKSENAEQPSKELDIKITTK